MADITLSGLVFFPFATGGRPTGGQVSEMAYYPRATPDTFEVINGRLSETNMGPAFKPIPRDLIRQGHLVDGRQVASSANKDVYAFQFPSVNQVGAAAGYADGGLVDDEVFNRAAVPVLAQDFYVPPGQKMVRMHWHLGIIHQGSHRAAASTVSARGDYFGRWRLFVDDQPVPAVTRDVRDSLRVLISDKGNASPVYGAFTDEAPDTRWWTGAYIIEDPTEGWHSVSIRFAAVFRDGSTNIDANFQGRVRARRMGYVVRK